MRGGEDHHKAWSPAALVDEVDVVDVVDIAPSFSVHSVHSVHTVHLVHAERSIMPGHGGDCIRHFRDTRSRSRSRSRSRLLLFLSILLASCTYSEHRLETLAGRTTTDAGSASVSLDDRLFGFTGRFTGVLRADRFNRVLGFWIFLRGPHRRDRVPVVLIHGHTTGPRPLAELAESLDPERFEPWYCYYATGIEIDRSSVLLRRSLAETASRYNENRVIVIAYSFGGLVARQALLDTEEAVDFPDVPLFITVATPWNGSDANRFETDRTFAPGSWFDIHVGSYFLTHLFDRRLPESTAFHMVYSFDSRDRRRIPGDDDGVIAGWSLARPEAVAEARSVTYIPETHHLDVIRHPRTIARVGVLLEEFWESRRSTAPVPGDGL
jgi:pimeloyl-ACP methyl ester carboxylesterase